MSQIHAFTDDALGMADAVSLADDLRNQRVSAAELVDAALARAATVGNQLGATALIDAARARAATENLRPGYFAGIPTFIKDNVDVAGWPTQHGSDAFKATPCTTNGAFAEMFLATGLVPLGKTAMSEFGFSASAEHPRLGPVRCPWDPDRTAGASSAGAAALVAAGVVPIAHANDGGGSIRIPASVNGLVGLKATRGRIPQDARHWQQPVRTVADGIVSRTVRDTAAFFREAERIAPNRRLRPIGDVTDPGTKRLRIALITESVKGRKASDEVAQLTFALGDELERMGHCVEHVRPPLPGWFADDFLAYWSFRAERTIRRATQSDPNFDPELLTCMSRGLLAEAPDHRRRVPLAILRLRSSAAANTLFHLRFDVVLTPTLATETPQIGHLDDDQTFDQYRDRLLDWVTFTPFANAAGTPSVSLPLAQTAAGRPQGMMFSAGHGHEATLLRLAYELEQARPFATLASVVSDRQRQNSNG